MAGGVQTSSRIDAFLFLCHKHGWLLSRGLLKEIQLCHVYKCQNALIGCQIYPVVSHFETLKCRFILWSLAGQPQHFHSRPLHLPTLKSSINMQFECVYNTISGIASTKWKYLWFTEMSSAMWLKLRYFTGLVNRPTGGYHNTSWSSPLQEF